MTPKGVISANQMSTTELKAKQEVVANAARKKIASKKTAITCVKGKLTKKVTAVKPKCPSGYKVKKWHTDIGVMYQILELARVVGEFIP